MATAGVLHFTHTATFASMVPHTFPRPHALVLISGICELALAVGLLLPRMRVFSAYGLMALFIAVFPANISMALHPERELDGLSLHVPELFLWLRLPLQFVLIAWAYRQARAKS